MRRHSDFADHALDLFALLGPGVLERRMFGGLGFYFQGLFFAIGDPEGWRIYLKADDQTRPELEAAGGEPFVYESATRREVSLTYFTPPDAALEDAEAMLPWARRAVEAARRAAAAKAAKAAKKAVGKVKAKKSPAKAKGKQKRRVSRRPGTRR